MNEDLMNMKSCASCGADAVFKGSREGGYVECSNKDCLMRTPYCPNPYNAVYRWNQRHMSEDELLMYFNGWLDGARYDCDLPEHD